jgi:hypothetical protein
MPDGCNFYGLLQTKLPLSEVAKRFAAAGWRVTRCSEGEELDNSWGHLTLTAGAPLVLMGRVDRPDAHVGGLLGLLGGAEMSGVYQWINSEGRLWREMPFDESMLDPDDPRLPADIKESIRANRVGSAPRSASPKPWWQFWKREGYAVGRKEHEQDCFS